jgi:predicted DNA binding CopG/RHH family protein
LYAFKPDISPQSLSEPEGDQKKQERRARMKRRRFHDDEERDLIAAYESGEFRPVKDQQSAKQTAVEAARRYLRKDARVNIRLSTADLEMLKRRAAEEGLPYQTLIASILHKYVSGNASSGSKGG